jgi:hypothetical protein
MDLRRHGVNLLRAALIAHLAGVGALAPEARHDPTPSSKSSVSPSNPLMWIGGSVVDANEACTPACTSRDTTTRPGRASLTARATKLTTGPKQSP